MNHRLLPLALLSTLAGLTACSGPVRDETFPLDPDTIAVTIRAETGNISATRVETGAPRIVAHIEGRRANVRHDVVDGQHELTVDCPPAAVYCSVDFELILPVGLTVDLATESGDVTIDDLDVKSMILDAGSGDLDVRGVRSDALELVAGSGNVSCTDSEAEQMEGSSGSGDVTLELVGPPAYVSATSGSGNVTVFLPPGPYDVTTHSDSGQTRVSGIEPEPGASSVVVAKSGSGDVDVRARE